MNRLIAAVLGLVLAVAAPLAAQAPAQPAKIQVLLITGQLAAPHDYKTSSPVLKKILEDTNRFEVRVVEEFRGATAEMLKPYDMLILNYRPRPDHWWPDYTQKAVEDFVASGKGLILYHITLASFDGWKAFEQMSGGNWRYNPNQGTHAPRHNFEVKFIDREHPITKGLKASFAQPNDELYANLRWQPEGSYHVLATAWDDFSLYPATNEQKGTGPGKDQPVIWTTNFGKGRVFIMAPGHDASTMGHAGYQVTFARGAEWAATGKVTLPIPPEMADR